MNKHDNSFMIQFYVKQHQNIDYNIDNDITIIPSDDTGSKTPLLLQHKNINTLTYILCIYKLICNPRFNKYTVDTFGQHLREQIVVDLLCKVLPNGRCCNLRVFYALG